MTLKFVRRSIHVTAYEIKRRGFNGLKPVLLLIDWGRFLLAVISNPAPRLSFSA